LYHNPKTSKLSKLFTVVFTIKRKYIVHPNTAFLLVISVENVDKGSVWRYQRGNQNP